MFRVDACEITADIGADRRCQQAVLRPQWTRRMKCEPRSNSLLFLRETKEFISQLTFLATGTFLLLGNP